MNEDVEYFEFENRDCPICGNHIKAGSPTHHCKKEALAQIDRQQEESEKEEDRTYDDKLEEFDIYYNQDIYYEKEDEKE